MCRRVTQQLSYTTACAAVALLTLSSGVGGQQPAAARPAASLDLRYEYIGGGKRDDGSACPGARQNGRVLVDGKLSYFGGEAPTGARYDGLGRVTVDFDGCDVKPVPPEQDPYCEIGRASCRER